MANAAGSRLSLIVRAYDDGIAYCYRIHGTARETVVGEASGFAMPPCSHGWLARYTVHYEADYEASANLAGLDYDLAMPALFRTPNGDWVLVSEADVDGRYAGAHLRFTDSKRGLLCVRLPEEPPGRFPGPRRGGSRSSARN